MTKFSDDDRDLVDFLCQHRPKIPPASPDLSQQILQQVENLPIQPLPHRSRLWLVTPVIAAGLIAALFSWVLVPAKPSEAELATLQTFIESNWQGTVSEYPKSDLWYFTDLTSD
ncbi:hypothetical protein I8752_25085 [Nostocaceae cyanobacterium CENA369]|uniref:Uncharacterized protein n=1 Tax=Dendronalium phyllosphericum CENA369 TaxID=1725256 RepID=A0A8J7LGF0_9NOST|nr:hypothetical protein [Dendronalium phyllosphericum]MBH8576206.1 hypothetical protein [Dendronalium phyllosphericum CENA369]